jgi:hypothetical protein
LSESSLGVCRRLSFDSVRRQPKNAVSENFFENFFQFVFSTIQVQRTRRRVILATDLLSVARRSIKRSIATRKRVRTRRSGCFEREHWQALVHSARNPSFSFARDHRSPFAEKWLQFRELRRLSSLAISDESRRLGR